MVREEKDTSHVEENSAYLNHQIRPYVHGTHSPQAISGTGKVRSADPKRGTPGLCGLAPQALITDGVPVTRAIRLSTVNEYEIDCPAVPGREFDLV
jgi:hypothetical protein